MILAIILILVIGGLACAGGYMIFRSYRNLAEGQREHNEEVYEEIEDISPEEAEEQFRELKKSRHELGG